MRKRYSWLVLLFVIALVASACSSDDDGGTDTTQATTTTADAGGETTTTQATTTTAAAGAEEPAIKTDFGVDLETKTIRLGLLADLTGPVFSTLVVPITDAQSVYWEKVNAAGGINGWTVELVIEDTMYDGPTHIEKYEKIRDDVVAISQSTGSPTSVANLPNTVEDDMLFIPLSWYSGWSIESFDSGNAFEQNTNYCIEAMNLVHFVQDMGGGTKIALATFPGDYGFDVAAGVKMAAEFYGLEITYDGAGAVIPGQDYAAVIQGIATSGADWTIFATNPSIGATILAGAVQNGYGGRFTGALPSYHPALLNTPAAGLYDAKYYQSAYNVVWGDDAPGNVEMMEAMTAAYPDRQPDDAFIIGWNESVAMHRVLEAAIASGDLTRLGVKTAANTLTGIDFGGSQPNQSYAGTPDEFVLRSLAIMDINLAAYTAAGGADQTLTQPDGTTGSELAVDFFVGDMADQFVFEAACYEL